LIVVLPLTLNFQTHFPQEKKETDHEGNINDECDSAWPFASSFEEKLKAASKIELFE